MTPTEGVVTDAWPYVIACYGLLWLTLAGYGGMVLRSALATKAPATDAVSVGAIAGGAVWILLGIAIVGYDYAAGLALPKALLYAWSLPGLIAITVGIVRQP